MSVCQSVAVCGGLWQSVAVCGSLWQSVIVSCSPWESLFCFVHPSSTREIGSTGAVRDGNSLSGAGEPLLMDGKLEFPVGEALLMNPIT